MVPKLGKMGIRVIGLGVGTARGSMIPDGQGGFMKDEDGAVVLSKLESGTLRKLAGATHGVYRDASEWVDLPGLVSSTVDQGRRGRFVEQNTTSALSSATSGRSPRPWPALSQASASSSRCGRSRAISA